MVPEPVAELIPDIGRIIDSGGLIAHFQQIVSISRKAVIGLEGLIRGACDDIKELLPPQKLFDAAKNENLVLELDRVCREIILKEFACVYRENKEKLLFLNLDASVLEYSVGSGYLLNQVTQNRINPRNIVLEITEQSALSSAALKRFTDTYKQSGFMVALDDVGTGFSNMDRILIVKPNIIKVDISLVRNIHRDFYKQGIFRSLVILANKIGALIIAEGAETEEEAIQILRLGGHMIQGYYFSVPAPIGDGRAAFENPKIELLKKRFYADNKRQYLLERSKHKRLGEIVTDALERLKGTSRAAFDSELREIVSGSGTMECAYILDGAGTQISATTCIADRRERKESLIFYEAQKGTDHSMEKYYYQLSGKRKRYTTEPYISLATGNLCVTISAVFMDGSNSKCIFCADFLPPDDLCTTESDGVEVHT